MSVIAVDFEWYRAFSTDGSPGYDYKAGKIREVGREIEPIKPLDFHKELFLDFAALDDSPSACVGFASRWGLLKVLQISERPRAEPLADWREGIGSMRRWIAQLKDKTAPRGRSMSAIGTQTDVFLQFGAHTPSLVLRPATLIDALRLQMADFFSDGNAVAACIECGKTFATGEARRADAKFCSDSCRFRYHNKRRAGK
jgi:hypothetical protein